MDNAIESRLTAFRIVRDVVCFGKTTDDAFSACKRSALAESDKHFVRQLALTTLRHYGQIQSLIAHFLTKPLGRKLRDIQLILSLGVAQIIFLQTPSHAAVDTSVRLVKQMQKTPFAGLVNGVLRRLDREKANLSIPSCVENLPEWLLRSWQKTYGKGKTQAIAEKLTTEPLLDITVKENPLEWAARWGGVVLETGTVRVNAGEDITKRAGYETGEWWIQEASASIPAQLFPSVKGKRVADLCSAPGGKTAQLVTRGAIVDAYDISERRLNRLHENINRLGMNESVRVFCADVSELKVRPENLYDAVLLDAPCSATGTIRRHPDLLFHRTADDVIRLSLLQRTLLKKAVELVKPGGYIVYATCSLQSEENETVVQDVVQCCPMIKRVELPEKWARFKNNAGALQVLPDQGQDGFYATLLRKDK